MFQPGSKNWIDKYFSLLEEGSVQLEIKEEQTKIASKGSFLHNIFFKTGIIFGFPSEFIFFREDISTKWTTNEKTSLLLLECMLLVYKTEKGPVDKEEFVDSLLDFYQQYNKRSVLDVLKVFFKESKEVKLEMIFKKRIHIKKTLTNQLWVSYIDNSLIYLDVLAFRSFLLHQKELKESYDTFLSGALYTIGVMALADNKVGKSEQNILSIFLKTSSFPSFEKKEFKKRLQNKNLFLTDIPLPSDIDDLYKLYLVDMAVLTLHSDLSDIKAVSSGFSNEIIQLNALCKHLGIQLEQLQNSIIILEKFVMENNHKITFIHQTSSYENLYRNFSTRWIKILGRSKDKFIRELVENKELIEMVNQSFQRELTEEEKEKVKGQFKDLAKTLPAAAIFMLPGGTILLPIILKIIPGLIPSAFKNN